MTKNLRKAIVKCSQLENKYISNSGVGNMNKYQKYIYFFGKLCKKGRKKLHSQLDVKNITNNKLFWKTMKSFFSEKCTYASKMSLVYMIMLSLMISNKRIHLMIFLNTL